MGNGFLPFLHQQRLFARIAAGLRSSAPPRFAP
jgi:hypothetical protein